jgi:hypothetical protein
MNIFVITSNYFDGGLFGTYSTISRARKVIETFFKEEPDIVSYEDIGDYTYKFTATNGKEYTAEILYDCLDAEYEAGMVKEDE